MDIIKSIEASKQEKFSQEGQCVLSFFKNKLNLEVLDMKDDTVEFLPTKVLAENKNIPGQKYFFEVENNLSVSRFEAFSLVATLVKVENGNISYECHLSFKFKDEIQRYDEILKKDISVYLEGKEKDSELEFVLHLLKEKTKKYKSNFVERTSENKKYFKLSLEDKKVVFSEGFQNSIQIDFQNGSYCLSSLQLIYREISAVDLEKNLDKIMSIVENFINRDLIVSSFNLNPLIDFARHNEIWVEFNSRAILKQNVGLKLVDFVVGDILSYNSIYMEIKVKENLITLKANYLMIEELFEFTSIKDLISKISELNKAISEIIEDY